MCSGSEAVKALWANNFIYTFFIFFFPLRMEQEKEKGEGEVHFQIFSTQNLFRLPLGEDRRYCPKIILQSHKKRKFLLRRIFPNLTLPIFKENWYIKIGKPRKLSSKLKWANLFDVPFPSQHQANF